MKDRVIRASNALIEAYRKNDLVYGSCRRCAVGVIVKNALGTVDTQWWRTVLAFIYDTMDMEDKLYGAMLQKETGYSLLELFLIDVTFEGGVIEPGLKHEEGRPSMLQALGSVLDILNQLEDLSDLEKARQVRNLIESTES